MQRTRRTVVMECARVAEDMTIEKATLTATAYNEKEVAKALEGARREGYRVLSHELVDELYTMPDTEFFTRATLTAKTRVATGEVIEG